MSYTQPTCPDAFEENIEFVKDFYTANGGYTAYLPVIIPEEKLGNFFNYGEKITDSLLLFLENSPTGKPQELIMILLKSRSIKPKRAMASLRCCAKNGHDCRKQIQILDLEFPRKPMHLLEIYQIMQEFKHDCVSQIESLEKEIIAGEQPQFIPRGRCQMKYFDRLWYNKPM